MQSLFWTCLPLLRSFWVLASHFRNTATLVQNLPVVLLVCVQKYRHSEHLHHIETQWSGSLFCFLNSIWLQCKIYIFFPNFTSIHTYGCPCFFRLLSFSLGIYPLGMLQSQHGLIKGWHWMNRTDAFNLLLEHSPFPLSNPTDVSAFVLGKRALFGESFPTLHNKTFLPPEWQCLLRCTPGSFTFSWLTLNWQLNHYRFRLWQSFCPHGHRKL